MSSDPGTTRARRDETPGGKSRVQQLSDPNSPLFQATAHKYKQTVADNAETFAAEEHEWQTELAENPIPGDDLHHH